MGQVNREDDVHHGHVHFEFPLYRTPIRIARNGRGLMRVFRVAAPGSFMTYA